MFTALHALAQSATLMIVVAAEGDDLRVNITPTQAGDKTKPHKLQPLSLVASPAELDDGFAAAIASWQAPKLTLQQQVEAANKAGTDDGDDAAPASSKAASEKTQSKRNGPGRPRKNETTPAGGENKAGTDNAGQQESTPPGDGGAPPEIVLPPVNNPAIAAAVAPVSLDLF